MKKKLLLVLLALACCSACALGFAACGDGSGNDDTGGNTHEHTYSTEWTYDETYHWHAATCEHNNEVSDKAEHIFTDNICTVCGYEKEIPSSEGLAFELNENGDSYIVAGIGTATDTNIVIPNIYNDKSVTGIKSEAFYENETIKSVIISDSVTNIGSYAFAHCNALTDVTIGSGVKNIEKQAFAKCISLENVIIKDGVTMIGETMFWECPLKKITIPDSVTVISKNAFYDCTNLSEVTIGNCVTNIGELSFYGCKELTKITIPANVTSIDRYAFGGCNNLQNITLSEGLITIGEKAFSSCYNFTKIAIPDSVTSVGAETFYFCNKMTDLTLGKGIKSIGKDAFKNCNALTNIYYTGDMASWCAIEFSNVYASPLNEADNFYVNNDDLVRDYIMPDNVKTIGKYAFSQYEGLHSIDLGEGVATIAENAFDACWELKKLTFGSSVETIGKNAFMSCVELDNVYYTGAIADWCDIIFQNDYSNPLINTCNLYINNELLIDLKIPDNITEIKPYAFVACNSICTVQVGDNVSTIGSKAFKDCENLYSVTIGKNVKTIEGTSTSAAFYSCGKLIEIYNFSLLDIIAGEDTHGWVSEYAKDVYHSSEEVSKIKTDSDGYVFYIPSGSRSVPKLLGYRGTETQLTLPESVDGKNYDIYQYAFYNNVNITSIALGNGVENIGEWAFYSCENLANITFGVNVNTLEDYAFRSCDALTNVILGDNVKSIERWVFDNCENLISITIPKSCTSIGAGAFKMTPLKDVYYKGTAGDWDKINIYQGSTADTSNQILIDASRHYI